MTPVGLPHSEIPGSKRACRSPRLIAACCVLHRLSLPRHPPSTLSNLTIKCLDLMRSAVPCSRKTCRAIIFIYNPYSIVNERWIAKIGVEGNPLFALTADARGHSCFPAGNLHNPMGREAISPQPYPRQAHRGAPGGADRDRTDDPLLAKQVLSQLSYSPGSD